MISSTTRQYIKSIDLLQSYNDRVHNLEAFKKHHPFEVWDKDGYCARFASMVCAAQTAAWTELGEVRYAGGTLDHLECIRMDAAARSRCWTGIRSRDGTVKITVTISKTLDDGWITDEQAFGMSDSDIIDLVKEDLHEFADGACIAVDRFEGVWS
jgi:hypothetical protein